MGNLGEIGTGNFVVANDKQLREDRWNFSVLAEGDFDAQVLHAC